MKVSKLLILTAFLSTLTFGAYAQDSDGSVSTSDNTVTTAEAPFSVGLNSVLNSGELNYGGVLEIPMSFNDDDDSAWSQVSTKLDVTAGPTLFRLSAGMKTKIKNLIPDYDFDAEFVIVNLDSTDLDKVDPEDRHFNLEILDVNGEFPVGDKVKIKLGVGLVSVVRDPVDGDLIASFGRTNLGVMWDVLQYEKGKTKARLSVYGEGSLAHNGNQERINSSIVGDFDAGIKGQIDHGRFSAFGKVGVYNTFGASTFSGQSAGNSDLRAEVGIKVNFGR